MVKIEENQNCLQNSLDDTQSGERTFTLMNTGKNKSFFCFL